LLKNSSIFRLASKTCVIKLECDDLNLFIIRGACKQDLHGILKCTKLLIKCRCPILP
jgi:hypothetical protein